MTIITRADVDASAAPHTLVRVKIERWLALGILGAAGVLVAHEFAYSLASAPATVTTSVQHGYLSLLWSIIGPLAGLTVGWVGVQRVRRMGLADGLSTSALLSVILPAFILLETGERALSGSDALAAFADPAVLLGIALCWPVAWLFGRLLDVAALAFGAGPDKFTAPRRRSVSFCWAPTSVEAANLSARLCHSVSRRGPPGLS